MFLMWLNDYFISRALIDKQGIPKKPKTIEIANC